MQSWDYEKDGCIKDILSGHCMQVAKLRALKEAMAFRKVTNFDNSPDDITIHNAYNRMSSYQWWKDISKEA